MEIEQQTVNKKPTFVSATAPISDKIAELMANKRKADLEYEKELARLVREMQNISAKKEKELAKHNQRAEARRRRPKNPAHSVVGVNQPKTLHPELIAFLRSNAGNMSDKARELVGDIMSLNQVKQCVQSLGVWAKVINDKSEYDFSAAEANSAFVASMRRLLVELTPAGFYKDEAGNVIDINFSEKIKTNRITKYFGHLLTTTPASEAFTAQRVAELTAEAAKKAAEAPAAEATSTEAAAPAAAAAAAAAPAVTEAENKPEPEIKKRKIQRKPAAPTA